MTRLGPIASGGCVDGRNCSERKLHTLKVNLECCNKNDCVKLRQEVSALREQLRRYILEDEDFLGTLLAGLAGSLVPALLGGKGLVLPGTKGEVLFYQEQKDKEDLIILKNLYLEKV